MEPDVTAVRASLRIACADALELLTELLEEALSTADRERLEAHLSGCEACAVHLDQLRRTVTVIREVGADDAYTVSPEVMQALVARYRGLDGGLIA